MANINLKSLVKESVLGDLPSSKYFKYNKKTGKYDAPGTVTEDTVTEDTVNEAPMDIELQEDIVDVLILVAQISKKIKSYSPKAFSKIQSVMKLLTQAKKDIRNV